MKTGLSLILACAFGALTLSSCGPKTPPVVTQAQQTVLKQIVRAEAEAEAGMVVAGQIESAVESLPLPAGVKDALRCDTVKFHGNTVPLTAAAQATCGLTTPTVEGALPHALKKLQAAVSLSDIGAAKAELATATNALLTRLSTSGNDKLVTLWLLLRGVLMLGGLL